MSPVQEDEGPNAVSQLARRVCESLSTHFWDNDAENTKMTQRIFVNPYDFQMYFDPVCVWLVVCPDARCWSEKLEQTVVTI